jgi:hypothetical protein
MNKAGAIVAYIDLNKVSESDREMSPSVHDGISFAHAAVQFAALGLAARDRRWSFPQYHLYALAIELAFKSLALRSGATVDECKKAKHDPGKTIELIQRHGTAVPVRLKTRLSDAQWFNAFLFMSRYPAVSELNTSLDKTIFLHPDYPEMIAEILEAPCKWPLSFESGSALAEIRNPPERMTIARFTETKGNKTGRTSA